MVWSSDSRDICFGFREDEAAAVAVFRIAADEGHVIVVEGWADEAARKVAASR